MCARVDVCSRPAESIEEMYRVLKPGGRAVALVLGSTRSLVAGQTIFEIVDKRVSSEVCQCFFNLGNKDMLARNFEASGFHVSIGKR